MKHIKVNLNSKPVKSAGKVYNYWALRWTDKNGKARTEHIGRADGPGKLSRRQANALRSRKEYEVNSGKDKRFAAAAPNLFSYLQQYINSRKTELAPGTVILYEATKKYLEAFFKNDPRIDQITKSQARAFKTALATGELAGRLKNKMMESSTVDGHMRNCRSIFNRAIEDEIVTQNPFGKLCSNKQISKIWRVVSFGEYTAMLNATDDINWKALLALCRLAGLRRGEALNLEWSDIDWEENTLNIASKKEWKTKTRQNRKVPICPELQAMLSDAHIQAPEGRTKVLRDFDTRTMGTQLNAIRRKARVKKYDSPFHSLRKSCAQDWVNNGVPPHALKEFMGHSKLETTMKYYLRISKLDYKSVSEHSFYKKSGENPVQKTTENTVDNMEK